jgi:hypothetical protein
MVPLLEPLLVLPPLEPLLVLPPLEPPLVVLSSPLLPLLVPLSSPSATTLPPELLLHRAALATRKTKAAPCEAHKMDGREIRLRFMFWLSPRSIPPCPKKRSISSRFERAKYVRFLLALAKPQKRPNCRETGPTSHPRQSNQCVVASRDALVTRGRSRSGLRVPISATPASW